MADDLWLKLIEGLRGRVAALEPAKVQPLVDFILEALNWLDPVMSRYCGLTCRECEDPCCSGQKIFFNQTDLLFLIASGFELPPGQTRISVGSPCRYLAAQGCTIPRSIRPYVCVWFICQPQMELFGTESARFQRSFVQVVKDVRTSRLLLEQMFETSLQSS